MTFLLVKQTIFKTLSLMLENIYVEGWQNGFLLALKFKLTPIATSIFFYQGSKTLTKIPY